MKDLEKLGQVLGYSFRNDDHLESALTHRSVGNGNNERLEFLGDAILSFVIADELFQRFPTAREGELSRFRSSLVKGETLSEIALEFNIGQYLRLGTGELKSGGFRRQSILADALEAIIGAIYLDSDIETVRTIILNWFQKRIEKVQAAGPNKDAKTQLQEYLQAQNQPLPEYTVLEITGKAHAQTFHIECRVESESLSLCVQGVGSSRRRAEQKAAEKALKELQSL